MFQSTLCKERFSLNKNKELDGGTLLACSNARMTEKPAPSFCRRVSTCCSQTAQQPRPDPSLGSLGAGCACVEFLVPSLTAE